MHQLNALINVRFGRDPGEKGRFLFIFNSARTNRAVAHTKLTWGVTI